MSAMEQLLATQDISGLLRIKEMLEERLTKLGAYSFRVGDRVTWVSPSRNGQAMTGTITQLNPKNHKVRADEGTEWRVHKGLLTKL